MGKEKLLQGISKNPPGVNVNPPRVFLKVKFTRAELLESLVLLLQVFAKKFYGSLPGQFGCGFIIPCRCSIIVKSMVGSFIDI